MSGSPRRRDSGARRAKLFIGLVAGALGATALYPLYARQRELGRGESLLRAATRRVSTSSAQASGRLAQDALSLRRERLDRLLSTWEAIGGCGAGSSAGAGSSVKWIGRSVRGGLFSAQLMTSYLRLPAQYNLSGGYTLSMVAQVTRDLGEKWNVGVAVPYLYKYYSDYYTLPLDISNAGLGDVSLLLTRRFGAINDTLVTATLGLPTGNHDARFRNDLLTQDKQLGHGRVTGSLTVDHVFDEVWGLIVLGGLASYRGGTNELGNYRAPMGSLYGHAGYYLGPFVPALGLTFNAFAGRDRDRTLEQHSPLYTLAGSGSIEWSSDYVAVLLGGSFPLRLPEFTTEPWIVAVGVAVSPF
ncbi:MAG TPA: hypothetical protein VFQ61_06760 [Polyangiaceae bacterium]|nr:hypothetical protein [Polyangiaceae bacterium]